MGKLTVFKFVSLNGFLKGQKVTLAGHMVMKKQINMLSI